MGTALAQFGGDVEISKAVRASFDGVPWRWVPSSAVGVQQELMNPLEVADYGVGWGSNDWSSSFLGLAP